ncbi:class I SAM-dependent methyltransferase [Halobacillus halophilus]|uniref:class I SAM-dependent methyltransferase n=1 Tax=Halobacillus halophilus TaxID=1570 RepID=UPI001CD5365E|nr:methyltransferase domain-containing protein [Halobacillus halophilus]MCA1012001.1 methyltransferase domain-containing protein [Halobacillus halophilus]
MGNRYLDLLAEFGIGGAHPGGFPLTKEVLSSLHLPHSSSVLDVGCGTGQTAEYLIDHFNCTVTAIDNHPVMVKKAAERLQSKVDVRYGHAENLEFADSTFDMVLTESVLSFTGSAQKTLKEIYRVLNEKGMFLCNEMTAVKRLSKQQLSSIKDLYGIEEVLTEDEWIHLLTSAGFESVSRVHDIEQIAETQVTDLRPSPNISEDLYDLWDHHNSFLNAHKKSLSYRIFLCEK